MVSILPYPTNQLATAHAGLSNPERNFPNDSIDYRIIVMLVEIDPSSDEPLFRQVAASIRADMAAQQLVPGDRLPPAKQVASGLGINAHTVRHAYQLLRTEGLLEMRRGSGVVVTSSSAQLADLHSQARALAVKAAELGVSNAALAAFIKEQS